MGSNSEERSAIPSSPSTVAQFLGKLLHPILPPIYGMYPVTVYLARPRANQHIHLCPLPTGYSGSVDAHYS